jgi:hypothetical protein
MSQQFYNLDANEGIFFARELEKVKSQTYDVKTIEYKARKLFETPDLDGDHGAKSIVYHQYEEIGSAKIIANYATDFPKVQLKGKEVAAIVKELGAAYSYTVKDIKASQKAGKSLDARLAMAVRKAMFQTEDKIAFFGDSANNLTGFFNHPNIPNVAVANNGSGGATAWSSKTDLQIIDDVNACINQVKTQTKGIEAANTVVLPVSAMALLKNKPFGTFGLTLLKFLQENNPEITMWEELAQLETAGTGNTRLMAAYNRSPMHVSLEIPMEFMSMDPQVEGAEYKIPCMQSIAGVFVYYPLSANFVYGF